VLEATSGCGRCIGAQVEVRISSRGRAYARGIVACGRIWTCPTCSIRLQLERAAEVESGAREWATRGGRLVMLTFTLRHTLSMSLADSFEAVQGGWRAVRNRRSYRRLRSLTFGTIRSVEVTYGENGWHPHLHVLYFVPAESVDAEVLAAAEAVAADWREVMGERAGLLPSVERAVAVTWLGVDTARYVAKIAKEVTVANGKGSRGPFSLLDGGEDFAHEGALFLEYAEVTEGRQSIAWSKGLREALGVDARPDSFELLDNEGDETDEVLARVAQVEWNRMWASDTLGPFFEGLEAEWRARLVVTRE
jgi:Replication protein